MNKGRPTNLLELAESLAKERACYEQSRSWLQARRGEERTRTRTQILGDGYREASERYFAAERRRMKAAFELEEAVKAERAAKDERDYWAAKMKQEEVK